VLSSGGIRSYSEGTTGIVDVRLTQDGTSFVLVGLRPGNTTLLLMTEAGGELHYRITVTDPTRETQKPEALPPVQARDNVRLDFYFVQLSRDGSGQVGIEWPASYGGGSVSAQVDLRSGTFEDATAVVTDQALPRLDLAQAEGWAKLLRKAAVVTANGTEATFGGGGEVNIPVESALSVGLRQIQFGSTVRVLPRYDQESGRLELTIHAEVSDLSSDRGSGIPGRVTSTLDSVVNLELGQSIVLAGLTARSETGSATGLPLLSQIPILGALFGTQRSRQEHTENVIFIVPSVVDAVSLDARDHLRQALDAFEQFDGELASESTVGPAPVARKKAAP
jgi:pilus assembly protein CpaC